MRSPICRRVWQHSALSTLTVASLEEASSQPETPKLAAPMTPATLKGHHVHSVPQRCMIPLTFRPKFSADWSASLCMAANASADSSSVYLRYGSRAGPLATARPATTPEMTLPGTWATPGSSLFVAHVLVRPRPKNIVFEGSLRSVYTDL